jgi:hypothetical protein
MIDATPAGEPVVMTKASKEPAPPETKDARINRILGELLELQKEAMFAAADAAALDHQRKIIAANLIAKAMELQKELS